MIGTSFVEVECVIAQLSSAFSLKDLGVLSFFLGIKVAKTATGLLLTQKNYIDGLLSKAKMEDCKAVSRPMVSTCQLSAFGGSEFSDPQLYRSTVGALQYVCVTRPDLSFCVNKVSQFMHHPLESHWLAVKRIL